MGMPIASLSILLQLNILILTPIWINTERIETSSCDHSITDKNVTKATLTTGNPRFTRKLSYDPWTNAGFILDLNCWAAGDPEPNITWYKDGKDLPKRSINYIHPDKWSLRMKSCSPEDQGNYTCVIRNSHGCIQRRFPVTIIDSLIMLFTPQSASLNGEANLTCPSLNDTLSADHIVWIKTNPNEPAKKDCFPSLEHIPPKIILQDSALDQTMDPRIYTIHSVSEEDQGWYTCVKVNNEEKVICDDFYLQVLNKSHHTFIFEVSCIAVVSFFMAGVGIICVYRKLAKEKKKKFIAMEEAKTLFFKHYKRIIVEMKIMQESPLHLPREIPVVRIETGSSNTISESSSFSEYEIPTDDRWEFPRKDLILGKTLGEGNFGKVMIAEAYSILCDKKTSTVAVKMLKESDTDSDMVDLVQEMEIMKMIGKHVNVLTLLGCCTKNGPLYVILEYAPYGNLRDFLRLHRPDSGCELTNECKFVDDKSLPQKHLISFALQIAKGMEYLTSRRFIHRDLAARNILVSDNYVMKIADFGLTRDINLMEYYKIGDGRLPVKWMAPEALFHRKYSSQSDVWSFGILLWEIMSIGGNPYPSVTNIEDLLRLLQNGYRMEKPSKCSREVYMIMRDCWSHQPIDRPTFSDLVIELATIEEEYLEFGVSLLKTPQSSFEESNFQDQQEA